VNPFREIADVRQTIVNKVYGLDGRCHGRVITESRKRRRHACVAQPFDIQKASGCRGIVRDDSGYRPRPEAAFLFNDAKDTLEATAHATGTGAAVSRMAW
jgi:hypothetical protein